MAPMARTLLLAALCVGAARAVIYEGGGPFSEEVVCAPGGSGRPTGVCRPAGKCAPGAQHEPSCGLPDADLKCCALPVSDGPAVGARSRRACQEFAKARQSCDNFQPPAPGSEVRSGDFPYLAGLGYASKSGNGKEGWFCGGALISDDFVLTAAHCARTHLGSPHKVRLGAVSFRKEAGAGEAGGEAGVQELDVAEVLVHPGYADRGKANDIALLRLAGRAVRSRAVQPACLLAEERLPVERLVVAGFGARLSPAAADSTGTLAKVDVPVVPYEKCKEIYKKFINESNSPTIICAGQEGRDTCTGDAGVPLVAKEGAPICNYQIAGVTSFGTSHCGTVPSVYTNVQAFLPWIEENVWK